MNNLSTCVANICWKSCWEASSDVAYASLPLLGVAAGAAVLVGVAKYCFGNINIALEMKRKAADLFARDLRYHRQKSSEMTQGVSMATVAMAATMMAMLVLKALPILGVVAGIVTLGGIGLGAVLLTNMIHERLVVHDGRAH